MNDKSIRGISSTFLDDFLCEVEGFLEEYLSSVNRPSRSNCTASSVVPINITFLGYDKGKGLTLDLSSSKTFLSLSYFKSNLINTLASILLLNPEKVIFELPIKRKATLLLKVKISFG